MSYHIQKVSTSLQSLLKHKKVLVCGDGDFSFSKALSALGLHRQLISTTLDNKESLSNHFPQSVTNIKIIESVSINNKVLYNIDATKLMFPNEFDIILWNFPHIIGKANIRYNRELLRLFLNSALPCLTPYTGRVVCALCGGQSGLEAKDKIEWDRSWKLPNQAAEAGMIITDKFNFDYDFFSNLGYIQQGHRGYGIYTYILCTIICNKIYNTYTIYYTYRRWIRFERIYGICLVIWSHQSPPCSPPC